MSVTPENIILTPDELHEITGLLYPAAQIKWLKKNHWQFVVNHKNKPIVGRDYARSKLAGSDKVDTKPARSLPNFENVR